MLLVLKKKKISFFFIQKTHHHLSKSLFNPSTSLLPLSGIINMKTLLSQQLSLHRRGYLTSKNRCKTSKQGILQAEGQKTVETAEVCS